MSNQQVVPMSQQAVAARLASLGLREAAQAAVRFMVSKGLGQEAACTDLATVLMTDAAAAKPARVKRAARA